MKRCSTFLWILFTCASCKPAAHTDNAPTEVPAVSIKMAEVQSRALPKVVEISGSLAAPEDSTIASTVDGRIERIGVDLGDQVSAGQVILRIDPEEYRLRMQQAQASLEQAENSLKRLKQLAETDMIAPQQYDDAKAQVLTTRAAFNIAKKKFIDTDVRAPFAGAVAKRQVSSGEYVRTGTALFKIVALNPLKLTGEVPERYVSAVKPGDPVSLTMQAFPGETFKGTISRISPAVNAASRAFTVEARVANDSGRLKPGVFAKAQVQVGVNESALIVPESAVSFFAGVTKVFSIDNNTVREHPVDIDQHLEDGLVSITAERLKAGDHVAVAGLARLANGVEVSVR